MTFKFDGFSLVGKCVADIEHQTSKSMRKGITVLVFQHIEEIRNWHPIPLFNIKWKILSNVIGSKSCLFKASTFMDNVTISPLDSLSICTLMSNCDRFELTSGAELIAAKVRLCYLAQGFFVPFFIGTDHPEVRGVWFRRVVEYCTKTWVERRLKMKMWMQWSLFNVDTNLVIRYL